MTALMPTVKHAQSFGGVFNSVFTYAGGIRVHGYSSPTLSSPRIFPNLHTSEFSLVF